MSEGIDFSSARPGGAAIRAAGKTFVIRYLYPDGQGGKGLDGSEVADYRAHGLLIGTVFETSAARALAGFAAGAADAHTAAAQLAALGMAGTPVYFAVDFAATTAQNATIASYLDGAASVLGVDHIGLYAGFGPIDALVGVHCKYGWQTYAWSGGRVSAKAHVYQYRNGQTLNGGAVDFCRNLQADFGAFGGTSLAGDGISILLDTPTVPIRRKKTMSTLYYQTGSAPTLYAYAGDSAGTPANWLETTDATLATAWSALLGAPSIALSPATYAAYKIDYLAPVGGATNVASAPFDIQPLIDAIKAIPAAPPFPKSGTITLG